MQEIWFKICGRFWYIQICQKDWYFDKLNIDKLEKGSSGLNSLKSKVGELGVDKLNLVLVDLKKLHGAVEKEVVKKTVCDHWLKNLILFRPLILVI